MWLYNTISCKGNGANTNDLEVTTFDNDGSMSEVLQPHLVQPNDLWVNYHLPLPAAVTKVQIRAVGSKPLALCEVIVLGGESVKMEQVLRRDFERKSPQGIRDPQAWFLSGPGHQGIADHLGWLWAVCSLKDCGSCSMIMSWKSTTGLQIL